MVVSVQIILIDFIMPPWEINESSLSAVEFATTLKKAQSRPQPWPQRV
jgi:hypothetical protein